MVPTEKGRLLLTQGDVAGIGPEIIAAAWTSLVQFCDPVVVGDVHWMARALSLRAPGCKAKGVESIQEAMPTTLIVPVIQATSEDLSQVETGRVNAAAGKAAYDFLCRAIEETLAGRAHAIVTAPLHKQGLHEAGIPFPGHTEILAARTQTPQFGMLLYGRGISVIHVTLHVALRDIFALLTTSAVLEKIRLLNSILPRLLARRPRIGVAGLNPHASDGGLFGPEERQIIQPAVAAAEQEGILVSGPVAPDAIFVRATRGEFDGVVAMYHDQGHIALKLLAGHDAVNISVGLPLVRTSVSHGTAYDIAWRGIAGEGSLIEAARVAAQLAGFPVQSPSRQAIKDVS
jgi:4-hydroxythreonine-4-phosphate dehydrogenase